MVLAQLTPRRFRACLPLIFAVCLVLVASIPAVAGDSERPVQASIFVSRTEASPTENVSFWIWIEPLKEKARKLVITEAPLDGFDVTSTTIPDSCLESRRTAYMGPRFGAGRDDGVVLHRNPASRERLAAGRRGRCGDLRQRKRWPGAPRERAHLTRRPSDATSGSPLAAAHTGRCGRPRLRLAIPIPPGRSHRPCLAPSLRSGRGLPPPPKRAPPASCAPDPICRLGLRHRRRDALGDPDVRRDDDGSVDRTLAGDPIPRWEYRLRDGGERDLGGAQCEGEPGPVRAACLGIPAPIRKVECSSPPELRWRRLAAPRD